jgi:hypothetical protein
MLNKFREQLKKKLDDEKVSEIIDFIKFIFIHGILGLFILLTIVSIGNIGFSMTTLIRNSYTMTIIVFLIGSGASYYMLMDISKFFIELRGKK